MYFMLPIAWLWLYYIRISPYLYIVRSSSIIWAWNIQESIPWNFSWLKYSCRSKSGCIDINILFLTCSIVAYIPWLYPATLWAAITIYLVSIIAILWRTFDRIATSVLITNVIIFNFVIITWLALVINQYTTVIANTLSIK